MRSPDSLTVAENLADGVAALALAAATGFALLELAAGPALALAAALASLFLTFALLQRHRPARSLPLAGFAPADWAFDPDAPADLPELLLDESDRLAANAPAADELLLDDVLARLAPNSRVVRLFEVRPLPTAGELRDNIERHLRRRGSAPVDESHALSEALADLRRSLR